MWNRWTLLSTGEKKAFPAPGIHVYFCLTPYIPLQENGLSSTAAQRRSSSGAEGTSSSSGGKKSRGPSGSTFKDLASKFLHPFNLDFNMARQNVERLKIKHHSGGGTGSQMGGMSSRPFSPDSDDSRTFEEGGSLHEELAEELVQELIVTPEMVLTLIAPLEAALLDWFKAQAAETLKDRLSMEEFQVCRTTSHVMRRHQTPLDMF